MELHLEVKPIGKGEKGRTACGSAAYRACTRIVDNAGNVHDYRNKKGYVCGGIELPEGAPSELLDRQTLWQRHELRDVRKDAELFREVVVALPNELGYEDCAEILRELSRMLTRKGMCVQWDIHDTIKNGQRNLHSHMMVTMRTLLPDGTFGNKDRSWNKYNGGLNIPELLRPEAARLMSEALARVGNSKTVNHRSYADRGIDKIPTKHVGVAATAMERKGVRTKKGDQNRYIEWLNKIHAENLRQVEAHTQSNNLEELISSASAQKDGAEVFRDWDALFAMVRDTRRCSAAMRTELGKLGKVISAYEENNADYLSWAGCDLANVEQKAMLQAWQDELRVKIKEMEAVETFLLDSKELLKAHNRVLYTANKVEWDRYLMDKNKRGVAYCEQRLESIEGYMRYLLRSITVLDAILNTKEYQEVMRTLAELKKTRVQLQERRELLQEAAEKAEADLKVHKKEAKVAKREEKKIRKAQNDGDAR